ncbi:TIGR03943 family protein [Streptomyces sp. GMY01]|uniref:TIGR03943 family putative permease subunit n=1 Tax=Streptomyces sp. GMY02 TaxID=1333528 RepID=UPI00146C361E|nr:TIGR03943 family protein [Streptomyces sp. GMY02]NMO38336.1 TIGR03943 family protein [Streptomyces sp. GMY02]
MNRQAQAAVLFLVGGALLHAGATDLYLRYVKAGLRPMLLVSGAVLVVTALMTVWLDRRRAGGNATHDEAAPPNQSPAAPDNAPLPPDQSPAAPDNAPPPPDQSPAAPGAEPSPPEAARAEPRNAPSPTEAKQADARAAPPPPKEPHAHREPRVAWLLLLPLFALILVAPPALGSYSAVRSGTALQPPYGYASLPPGDLLRLSVVDYATRAIYDHGRTLAGRRVQVTGFVALDGDGTPYLVRMALNCCAADAQPVKIALTGRVPPVLEPDTWLRVTGVYTARRTRDPVNDGPIPYLEVTAAQPVPTPADPYDESWNQ